MIMNRNVANGLFLIAVGVSLMTMVLDFRAKDEDAGFTKEELEILDEADSILRVLTIENPRDLSVLRAPSRDLSSEALLSEEFSRLAELMVATVTHPSQDGVGIAGPQIGLNRRVVAVQRFDKEGEPFEVYPNIRIVWQSDSMEFGPEGCLSVPERREDVARSTEIVIEYTAVPGAHSPSDQSSISKLKPVLNTVRETISGFTAVIFQHEVDHLDGILYIDRVSQ
jgi:peptide deformylase